jgi:hypothetical protein
LLGDADIALIPYVVTLTVKTRTRGAMLTSRSQLLNALGGGYARANRWTNLGGATGRYARGHPDIISGSLDGRRRAHPNCGGTHSESAATPWDRQSSCTSLTE